ncbi:MAG: DUF4160 domain-containing protein [Bradyrhizobium sp.]
MNIRHLISMRAMPNSWLRLKIRTNKVLRGSLPPAKLNRVLSWAARHQTGLMNAWSAVEELRKPEKIDE